MRKKMDDSGLKAALEAARDRYERRQDIDEGLRLAIKAVGTRYKLAKLLGIWPSSVMRWRTVPTDRILEVERVTGISRTKLRPELYT